MFLFRSTGDQQVTPVGKFVNNFLCYNNIKNITEHYRVSSSEHGTCLPGFKKFDKFCYLFKVWDRQTWSTARYRCNKQGGDLLSILNQQEKDYIVYQLKELRWKPWVWIGKLPFPSLPPRQSEVRL